MKFYFTAGNAVSAYRLQVFIQVLTSLNETDRNKKNYKLCKKNIYVCTIGGLW